MSPTLESSPRGPVPRRTIIIFGALVLGAGLGCRYGLSGFWAKYLGVMLWATEAYAAVLFVRPALSIRRASAAALIISWAVELLQLSPLPAWLSARHILLRLIFGTTFSAADLPAYLAGVALGALIHGLLRGSARSGLEGRAARQ